MAKNSHVLGADRKWDFHPKKIIAGFNASSGAGNLLERVKGSRRSQ